MEHSIFREYYRPHELVDRFLDDRHSAIDVIIPIIHTTELWEANLFSIYKEIPVNRLLLGDGGCIDDSIEIAKKFPRVVAIDQRHIKSLGYCIREMIEMVETEWFAYLHSDVYLPSGWFDVMQKYQSQYDWYGCRQQTTTIAEYKQCNQVAGERRPYAGSQIGRKAAFIEGLKKIDDDYVYRQEDFVFASIVEDGGFKNGYVEDTFHYHQMMRKDTPWAREIKGVSIEVEWSPEEKNRSQITQVKGIVKYLKPTFQTRPWLIMTLLELYERNAIDLAEFRRWAVDINPLWKGNINTTFIKVIALFRKAKKLFRTIRRSAKIFRSS